MGKVGNPYSRRDLMDCFTKEKRSENMSRIRSKGTKPEKKTIKWFKNKGYNLEVNKSNLPGKPDIVISEKKLIIFVHGCFWHNHPNCHRAKLPKTNRKFWKRKIEGNRKRDERIVRLLRKEGWHVMTVWQCALRNPERVQRRLQRMLVETSP